MSRQTQDVMRHLNKMLTARGTPYLAGTSPGEEDRRLFMEIFDDRENLIRWVRQVTSYTPAERAAWPPPPAEPKLVASVPQLPVADEDSWKERWSKEQLEMKKRLSLDDSSEWRLPGTPDDGRRVIRYIGGVDISSSVMDIMSAAALVVLDYKTLEVVYQEVVPVTLDLPYICGFLAFRETPHLKALLERCPEEYRPDVVLVDGSGVLHPLGFGHASQLGVEAGVSTIGVAKTFLAVDGIDVKFLKDPERLLEPGGAVPLKGASGRVWGAALRTTSGSTNPVFVSVGHAVSLDTALEIVRHCCKHRVPRPIQLADHFSREYLRDIGWL